MGTTALVGFLPGLFISALNLGFSSVTTESASENGKKYVENLSI